MKAMAIANFGEPEVFTELEVEKPIPNNNEVLVKSQLSAQLLGCIKWQKRIKS
ncbi:hypothetical protein [Nostoc sp. 106C]|uniref:hypothetical protein n=1 Tax=Nostoc sp. 106C TaxID=1932667 RepID=UPI001FB7D1DD|nr:hypothetical protein [Nostoc sp. 106C]